MELFRTADYYIFRQGEHSLWCSRKTGILEPRTGNISIYWIFPFFTILYIHILIFLLLFVVAWDLTKAEDPHCMGLVHGIVGKLNPFPGKKKQNMK